MMLLLRQSRPSLASLIPFIAFFRVLTLSNTLSITLAFVLTFALDNTFRKVRSILGNTLGNTLSSKLSTCVCTFSHLQVHKEVAVVIVVVVFFFEMSMERQRSVGFTRLHASARYKAMGGVFEVFHVHVYVKVSPAGREEERGENDV